MDFSLLDYYLSLFYTGMSVFSCESFQWVGESVNSGMFVMLRIWTWLFCIVFACGPLLPLFRSVHGVSGFS